MATFSRQYYPNPDEDFVLRGGSPSYYSELPGYLNNSSLTTTTKNLSQHTYNADRYVDEPQLRGSMRTVSRSLNRIHGELSKSLMEDDNNLRNGYHHGLPCRYSQLNEAMREHMNQTPHKVDFLSQSEWYTKPIHLSSNVNIPMSTGDVLAEHYFPVTLGQTKSLEMLEDVRPGTRRATYRPVHSQKQRSKSAGSKTDTTWDDTRRVRNQLYLTAEAPNIKAANISFTSPFSERLSKLRLEKLRIEEQQYLELKRQAELEKIRGPRPKWYELKNPDFHHEAHKNNELLRNSDKWDDLLRYRESLINSTTRLHNALKQYEVPAY